MEDTRLGTILLEHGVLPESILQQCLEIQALTGGHRPLGEILVEQGAISGNTLREILAIQERLRRPCSEALPISGDDPGRYLDAALRAGGTELVLSEGRVPRVRVGGELRALGSEPLAGPEVWNFVRDHMGLAVLEEIAESFSVTRTLRIDGVVRGRIAAFRHFDGLATVVRLQPQRVRTTAEVGIDEALAASIRTGKGLLLVAGEQGSGVTSTFASLLHEVAREPGRSVVVLDRTFEYPEPDGRAIVTMRRVGEHTATFASGMRAALLEEADVVFLGEVDRPTFDLALHAAEVGTLVVASVRARSAVSALERVARFRPPYDEARVRSVLASVLLGVIVVQVVPQADHEGVRLATEVLRPDGVMRELLRAGSFRRMRSLLKVGGGACGHDLDSSLAELVESGSVRFEDAFPFAEDKPRLLGVGSRTKDS